MRYEPIHYLDRETQTVKLEKVYGQFFIHLVYAKHPFSKWIAFLVWPICKIPFFSKLYGYLQKSFLSRSKIKPFIKKFQIDVNEFEKKPEQFTSFNDFFIRKLKPASRPIDQRGHVAILPADARYLAFQNIAQAPGFYIKGAKFSLEELLGSSELALHYAQGSALIARLCPTDYHRFHFPCDGVAGEARLINGYLFSVNPIALKQNIHILTQNKRYVTEVETSHFGRMLYIEIGATYVGSIKQTYRPDQPFQKGAEKGFFSFGGSCVILLFELGRIKFDQDLLEASQKQLEVRGLLGQSLGSL